MNTLYIFADYLFTKNHIQKAYSLFTIITQCCDTSPPVNTLSLLKRAEILSFLGRHEQAISITEHVIPVIMGKIQGVEHAPVSLTRDEIINSYFVICFNIYSRLRLAHYRNRLEYFADICLKRAYTFTRHYKTSFLTTYALYCFENKYFMVASNLAKMALGEAILLNDDHSIRIASNNVSFVSSYNNSQYLKENYENYLSELKQSKDNLGCQSRFYGPMLNYERYLVQNRSYKEAFIVKMSMTRFNCTDLDSVKGFFNTQSKLDPDLCIIAYSFFNDDLYIYTIKGSIVKVKRLDFEVNKLFSDPSNYTQKHLQLLYSKLIEPIEEELKHEIIILPSDGAEAFFPFFALRDKDGNFLIEKYKISFSTFPPTKKVGKDNIKTACILDSEDLKHSIHESNSIKETLMGRGVQCYSKAENLEECNVVHLAMHSNATSELMEGENFQDTILSWLKGNEFMATGQLFRNGKQFLHATSFGEKCLSKIKLVVFSSCNSGKGKYVPGEGLLGFVYNALISGVDCVISTGSEVNDAYMRILMSDFYKCLTTTNMDVGSSIRSAILQNKKKKQVWGSVNTWGSIQVWGYLNPSFENNH
ncbi:predicted protein [Naegleria gruberi]|uniref:Predicted protein n=1 Tax=Naegleria gruberi TaxID=5762 RepID=D2W5U9_NAEGR|nr:uncharacterized protein NAEGRDRAFT_76792 [Naegleria gruberi]EFC35554.1 predicted protein [Naegleria gruberi]|eukprot:XP_002668298.1 predicted protein [Naegleria gruberi strain NEG-M]